MNVLLTKKYGSLDELIDFMQDYAVTRELGIVNRSLEGLTVIIDPAGAGNVTTTFTSATSPTDLIAALNAAVPGAAELRAYGHAAYGGVTHAIAFVDPTHVIQAAGTANALLGLSTITTTTPMTSVVASGQIKSIFWGNPITIIYDDWVSEATEGFNDDLTAAYVAGTAVRIDHLRNISLLLQFTTGATGITDEWLPQIQVEVSSASAPVAADWRYINARGTVAGVVTNTRATYVNNANVMYTAPATAYRDTVAAFENNPGWKWMRMTIKESKTPTNQGTALLTISGSKR